jgi:hypothetical protein
MIVESDPKKPSFSKTGASVNAENFPTKQQRITSSLKNRIIKGKGSAAFDQHG